MVQTNNHHQDSNHNTYDNLLLEFPVFIHVFVFTSLFWSLCKPHKNFVIGRVREKLNHSSSVLRIHQKSQRMKFFFSSFLIMTLKNPSLNSNFPSLAETKFSSVSLTAS